jgi:hypothetical protein
MGDRSAPDQALIAFWYWREKIQRSNEERDQLIREALPLYGVSADELDADLARVLFEVTLHGDEYDRSDRIRKLLRMVRAVGASAGAQHEGDAR